MPLHIDGTLFLMVAVYLALGVIVAWMPDSFPRFQRNHPGMSYPIVNFSLPFEVDETSWPRVKRVGSRVFFFFALLEGASALCEGFGLYENAPLPRSRVSGILFCGCICCYLIATALAARSGKKG